LAERCHVAAMAMDLGTSKLFWSGTIQVINGSDFVFYVYFSCYLETSFMRLSAELGYILPVE